MCTLERRRNLSVGSLTSNNARLAVGMKGDATREKEEHKYRVSVKVLLRDDGSARHQRIREWLQELLKDEVSEFWDAARGNAELPSSHCARVSAMATASREAWH